MGSEDPRWRGGGSSLGIRGKSGAFSVGIDRQQCVDLGGANVGGGEKERERASHLSPVKLEHGSTACGWLGIGGRKGRCFFLRWELTAVALSVGGWVTRKREEERRLGGCGGACGRGWG